MDFISNFLHISNSFLSIFFNSISFRLVPESRLLSDWLGVDSALILLKAAVIKTRNPVLAIKARFHGAWNQDPLDPQHFGFLDPDQQKICESAEKRNQGAKY